jgi:hypothetical protein
MAENETLAELSSRNEATNEKGKQNNNVLLGLAIYG